MGEENRALKCWERGRRRDGRYKIATGKERKAMGELGSNVMRSVVSQLAGGISDAGFAALVSTYNLPAGLTLGMAQALVKGSVQGVMLSCYDEVQKQRLSDREVQKHNMVFDVAERTYFELAAENYSAGDSQTLVLDDSYITQVEEIAEHASLEAIRQSETKKIEVIGRYYGGEFYKHGWNIDFQDMHQMITMVGMLTFRQIVLIRLIAEGFKDVNTDLFISNPSACVEVNRLRDYGIWKTEGAAFGINESGRIQLKSIHATDYSAIVCESLMLGKLSEDDMRRTIESLKLIDDGTPQEVLTIEEYRQHTEWQEFDEAGNLVLDGGHAKFPEAEEQAVRDIVRGK